MEDWMRAIIDNLTPDALPEPHRTLAHTIGMEAIVQLMRMYGGINYYIPKADTLLRQVRDKAIKAAYNGYNTKELAITYHLSQQHISRILQEGGIQDGQTSLLDAQTSE